MSFVELVRTWMGTAPVLEAAMLFNRKQMYPRHNNQRKAGELVQSRMVLAIDLMVW
jgi:hypothetical protein